MWRPIVAPSGVGSLPLSGSIIGPQGGGKTSLAAILWPDSVFLLSAPEALAALDALVEDNQEQADALKFRLPSRRLDVSQTFDDAGRPCRDFVSEIWNNLVWLRKRRDKHFVDVVGLKPEHFVDDVTQRITAEGYEIIRKLAAEGDESLLKYPYRGVVIDEVTEIAEWVREAFIQKIGRTGRGAFQIADEVEGEVRKWLTYCRQHRLGCVLIGHSRTQVRSSEDDVRKGGATPGELKYPSGMSYYYGRMTKSTTTGMSFCWYLDREKKGKEERAVHMEFGGEERVQKTRRFCDQKIVIPQIKDINQLIEIRQSFDKLRLL